MYKYVYICICISTFYMGNLGSVPKEGHDKPVCGYGAQLYVCCVFAMTLCGCRW